MDFSALLAVLGKVGAIAGTAVSVKALFSSPSGNNTAAQQQKVLDSITPSVMNQLQNRGITLPVGQEQQYVAAALAGQLPTQQVNMFVPLAIAGLGLFILVKD